MGKKKTRTSRKSKGERRSAVAGVRGARARVSPITKAINLLAMWRAGKNPWIVVPGSAPNAQLVRVKANDLYGNPKLAVRYSFNKTKGDE